MPTDADPPPGADAPLDPQRGDAPATVLGLSTAVRTLLIVGGPLLGLVLGYYLPAIAGWLSTLPWIPMRGPFRLIAFFDEWWAGVAFLITGLLLGALFAHAAITGSLRLVVTDRSLRLDLDERSRTVDRELIDAVFLDGPELVVLDRESRQLARERHESTAEAIAQAMRAHGYPWTEGDPYQQLYRRWVRDTPDLPASVNAVLVARETALRRKVRRDVVELGDEVQKLGFVVRDDGHRQYWRPLVRS